MQNKKHIPQFIITLIQVLLFTKKIQNSNLQLEKIKIISSFTPFLFQFLTLLKLLIARTNTTNQIIICIIY